MLEADVIVFFCSAFAQQYSVFQYTAFTQVVHTSMWSVVRDKLFSILQIDTNILDGHRTIKTVFLEECLETWNDSSFYIHSKLAIRFEISDGYFSSQFQLHCPNSEANDCCVFFLLLLLLLLMMSIYFVQFKVKLASWTGEKMLWKKFQFKMNWRTRETNINSQSIFKQKNMFVYVQFDAEKWHRFFSFYN